MISDNPTAQILCLNVLQHSQSSISADPKFKDNMTEGETGGQSQEISKEQIRQPFLHKTSTANGICATAL